MICHSGTLIIKLQAHIIHNLKVLLKLIDKLTLFYYLGDGDVVAKLYIFNLSIILYFSIKISLFESFTLLINLILGQIDRVQCFWLDPHQRQCIIQYSVDTK